MGFTKTDPVLFNLVLVLVCFGLIMCFSASAPTAQVQNGDSYYFLKRQMIWAVLGFIAMLFTSNFHYARYKKYSFMFYVATIGLLLIVLAFPGINGAKRWIGIGGFSFQPSEVAKYSLIIMLSHKMSVQNWEKSTFFKDFVPYLILYGVFALMLMLEPHFSCTLLLFGVTVAMLFVSGAKMKYFAICLLVAIPAIYFLAFSGYRGERMAVFLDPMGSDPSGEGWQIRQSLYAIGSGGMFGLGIGQSRQKFLYLPEPQNDFIFSVICEELGFLGAAVVILLFAALIWRGIYIAVNAPDKFSCYLATGITALIAIQIIVNIAVVTSSMPVTGMPLPFFSAGGSSLVFLMAGMGILLNISKSIRQNKSK
ncbi:MAG: putative lipid II flippase FtsW [Clostridia bacterium]|nr:putative lipid II flippase FtsW [Clostridia bacterium]